MFNNPEADYRAVRDMGLAAWWGASLMGLAGLVPASETQPDQVGKHRVLDAGWRGSRPFLAGAIGSYVLGVGLVRFDGKPLESNGTPRWITEGVESGARTVALVTALGAAIAAGKLRDKEGKIYEQQRVPDAAALAKADKLRKSSDMLHAVVPAALGWLMFSHIKEDANS